MIFLYVTILQKNVQTKVKPVILKFRRFLAVLNGSTPLSRSKRWPKQENTPTFRVFSMLS